MEPVLETLGAQAVSLLVVFHWDGGKRLLVRVVKEMGDLRQLHHEIGLAGLLRLLASILLGGHSEPLPRPLDDSLVHELSEARPTGGGLLFCLLVGRAVCGLAPIGPFLVPGGSGDDFHKVCGLVLSPAAADNAAEESKGLPVALAAMVPVPRQKCRCSQFADRDPKFVTTQAS